MQDPIKESIATKSALRYGIVAGLITAILGLVVAVQVHNAYTDVNDTAGLGIPQLGMAAAPIVGVIVGMIKYLWLIRE